MGRRTVVEGGRGMCRVLQPQSKKTLAAKWEPSAEGKVWSQWAEEDMEEVEASKELKVKPWEGIRPDGDDAAAADVVCRAAGLIRSVLVGAEKSGKQGSTKASRKGGSVTAGADELFIGKPFGAEAGAEAAGTSWASPSAAAAGPAAPARRSRSSMRRFCFSPGRWMKSAIYPQMYMSTKGMMCIN